MRLGEHRGLLKRRWKTVLPTNSAEDPKLGVDVFVGAGLFTGPDTVDVDGKTLQFAKAAICTGARAAAPPIPGLETTGYLTNETIFSLTERPPKLAVIGAGPIGCEMAQCFARFGSQVCIFERTAHILPREDADAAKVVQAQMIKDGVCFTFDSKVTRVERRGRERVIHYDVNGREDEWVVDEILVSVGRAPNVEGLGLARVGVEYDTSTGVKVNARLQTTNPRIFAGGDICFPFKFTHTADAMAQIIIQNALFPHPLGLGYRSTNSLIIPWCTYTEPEIAHVGMYETGAGEKGIEMDTFTLNLNEVDRAILDGEDEGFARVHVKKGTDHIVGATIVAVNAGDMISEFTLAMKGGLGLSTITGTIHPYPTQAEVIKRVANAWRKTTLTEGKKKFLRKLFAWTRYKTYHRRHSVRVGVFQERNPRKWIGGRVPPSTFGSSARSRRIYWLDVRAPSSGWLVELGTSDSLVPRKENSANWYCSPLRRNRARDFWLCPVWVTSA